MFLLELRRLRLLPCLDFLWFMQRRKVAAWFQQRIGPNRVGFQGVLQTAADITKLIMKEPLTAGNSDKFLYNLAPFIMMLAPFIVISALPYAKGLHVMDLNVGVLFVTAVSSIGVLEY